MANFPNGFGSLTLRGIPIQQTHTGKVFWVGNSATASLTGHKGASNGNRGDFGSAMSTLAGAVAQCVASRGDVIFVKPGHAETISSATALTLTKAGVAIIGLGSGSMRPTFTFDTATTASVPVSAANVSVKNCIFTANFADIVAPFTLTTAKYFTLEECYIKATATNMNFLYVVDTNATTADADGLAIKNCKWIEPDAATVSMVKLDGTNADLDISGNYVAIGVNNNKPALVIAAAGKVANHMRMVGNYVYRLNTDTATGAILYHTDGTTSSGIVAGNYVQHADTAAELLVTASDALGVFDNKASGVAGASGYLLPAADS